MRRGPMSGLGGRGGGRRRVGRCRSRGLPRPQRGVVATERLTDAVTASTRAYRTRLSVDLALIQGLLNMGDESTAAGALDEERLALGWFAEGLREALAEATSQHPRP